MSLLQLPREIRNLIYVFCLQATKYSGGTYPDLARLYREPDCWYADCRYTGCINILLLNQQIHDEALPYLYEVPQVIYISNLSYAGNRDSHFWVTPKRALCFREIENNDIPKVMGKFTSLILTVPHVWVASREFIRSFKFTRRAFDKLIPIISANPRLASVRLQLPFSKAILDFWVENCLGHYKTSVLLLKKSLQPLMYLSKSCDLRISGYELYSKTTWPLLNPNQEFSPIHDQRADTLGIATWLENGRRRFVEGSVEASEAYLRSAKLFDKHSFGNDVLVPEYPIRITRAWLEDPTETEIAQAKLAYELKRQEEAMAGEAYKTWEEAIQDVRCLFEASSEVSEDREVSHP